MKVQCEVDCAQTQKSTYHTDWPCALLMKSTKSSQTGNWCYLNLKVMSAADDVGVREIYGIRAVSLSCSLLIRWTSRTLSHIIVTFMQVPWQRPWDEDVAKENNWASDLKIEFTRRKTWRIDWPQKFDWDVFIILGISSSLTYHLIGTDILLTISRHLIQDLLIEVTNIGISWCKDHSVQKIFRGWGWVHMNIRILVPDKSNRTARDCRMSHFVVVRMFL